MSTNSTIIVKRPDCEEYASVYCHWDGYLGYNGKILLEHYTTYEQVVKLIQLGGLSSLGKTLDETTSYHLMRGEDKNIVVSSDIEDHTGYEYAYLFRDNEWLYRKRSGAFHLLTPEAIAFDNI